MSDLHLNCTNYIGISHAVSGNVPAPARNDKINTYDVVFLIGETNTTVKGKTKFLIPHKSDVVFPIGETNKNNTSQT